MKKIFQFLFFAFIALFGSCAVFEDVYFASDGKIKYELLVKISEPLSTVADTSSQINESEMSCETILFSDVVKGEYSDFDSLPQAKKDLLRKLESCRLEFKRNPTGSRGSILFAGEFANIQAMTEVLISLDSIMQGEPDNKFDALLNGTLNFEKLTNRLKISSLYTWNGKSMSRKSANLKGKEIKGSNDLFESDDIIANSEYTVRYHFPKKIKSVSNKNATLSEDGATVILTVPLVSYNHKINLLDIDIKLEK